MSAEVPISPPSESAEKRQSMISDVTSGNSALSAPDSDIEFAVRDSIPMANAVEEAQGGSCHDEIQQEVTELPEKPSSI